MVVLELVGAGQRQGSSRGRSSKTTKKSLFKGARKLKMVGRAGAAAGQQQGQEFQNHQKIAF